jgi:pilus assembly protein Flp/PilA
VSGQPAVTVAYPVYGRIFASRPVYTRSHGCRQPLPHVIGLLKDSLKEENGQDLIEYALVVALIAFAATVGMKSLATGINTAFGQISTDLTTAVG